MDPVDRIVQEFDRLVARRGVGIATWPFAECCVFYVVNSRCAIDTDGFASLFEQSVSLKELSFLITALDAIDEPELAAMFASVRELLVNSDFYAHKALERTLPAIEDQVEAIGKRIGDKLWDLDPKLAALLDRERPN